MNNKIVNIYELESMDKFKTKDINPNYKYHQMNLGRYIIIGGSGSGKTTVLMNIISQFSKTFNHIYIYTQKEEQIYTWLDSKLPSSVLTIKYGIDNFINFKDEDYYGQSLLIFDDMVNESKQKQVKIQEMFIRGRKMKITMMYLTQSFFAVPKMIRLQCDNIILIKITDSRDLKLILSCYSLNISIDNLLNMYKYACDSFGNFLLIDLAKPTNKQFRKNFKEYLNYT